MDGEKTAMDVKELRRLCYTLAEKGPRRRSQSMNQSAYCPHICDKCIDMQKFMAEAQMRAELPRGWVCPSCNRIYGPSVKECVECSKEKEV